MINKKLFITIGLTGLIVFGALASMPPEPEKAKNLKVLPKNLTHDQIEVVMRQWTKALGVRCNFCHERGNNAADTKPEKEMAREMFKMTAKINSKYFKGEKDSLGMMAQSGIACITCHRGSAHPDVKALLTAPQGGGQGGPGFGPQGGPGSGRPGAGGPPPQGGAGAPPPPPAK